MVKLAVIIVHYNTSADLSRCLESLNAYPPHADHQVVIVDNASTDLGLEEVHQSHQHLHWIFSKENLGYAKGCNRGMAAVAAQYYLVLNPDIVVQPGALDRLVEFADSNPRAGLIGPQLLNEDGSIQDSCRRFYTFRTLLLRRTFLGRIFSNSNIVRQHLMKDFDHRSNRPVDWVLGGCILVRREALDRTGPMDERFFLYFEDVDWCYRMWQAGWDVLYSPEARFMHRHRRDSGQGTFNRSFWLHLGSLISFYEKWGMLVWLLKKWRDPLAVFFLWLLDMAGLAIAFGTAYGIRGLLGGLFSEPLYPLREYLPVMGFSALIATVTFMWTGRYRKGWDRRPASWFELMRQLGAVALLLLASTYLGHLEVVSRAVLLMFIFLLGLTTIGGEMLVRRGLRRLEKGFLSLERTLLVGEPDQVQGWLAGTGDMVNRGVDIAGYVADPGESDGGLPALRGGEIPWLGKRQDLLEIVSRYRISQVVFWQRPEQIPGSYRLLANLRRLRIRLRWHLEDTWLLATGARAELFGSELSGVQEPGTGSVLRTLLDRSGTVLFGLVLWLLALFPWVWLRLVRVPRREAGIRRLQIADLWGYNPDLQLAVDRQGRVLPLVWQLELATALIRGELSLHGPRFSVTGEGATPAGPSALAGFWREGPRSPGLTGAWAAEGAQAASGPPTLAILLRQMWFDPGGVDSLLADLGQADDRADGRHSAGEET